MTQLSVRAEDVVRRLHAVRRNAPLVQCITNTVVQNVTANALLALGASPAMTDIVGESGPFARIASGLLVNLGTPTPEQRDAAQEAVAEAQRTQTPWVLDPVAIGALPIRTALAHDLAGRRPAAIRGNASEIAVLAGSGDGGRGTDSSAEVDVVLPAAQDLARRTHAIVAVSGPVDAVTDGERTVRIANGTDLLTRITGGGCALGAAIAAFLGADRDTDRLIVVSSAIAAYTIAAEIAAEDSEGPGSFQVRFLDALFALDATEIVDRIRTEVAR